MCGIAGAFGARDERLIEAMLAALAHRGPDGRGTWRDGPWQLGVTRLAIVDPPATSQPLTNETGTLRLVFNGEIYNHRELRAELLRRGHRFSTATDSEVVVHLYEEEGAACVHRLRGMFAFALLDGDELLLARDRLGIKPLYYSVVGHSFIFASEIKALLRCDELPRRLDMQAFADRTLLGHAVATQTYLEGVRSLAPGHTMTVSSRGGRLRTAAPEAYFDRRAARDEAMSYEEAQAALEDALEDAVARHLDADVDVGVALSGGLDSTMLAMLARDQDGARLQTFSLADHEGNPDLVMAARVAAMIGADHHSSVVQLDEYIGAIPDFIAIDEQPSSLIGMPFYLLSRRVGERLKACLCGEGADELFGGYRDYLEREAEGRVGDEEPAGARAARDRAERRGRRADRDALVGAHVAQAGPDAASPMAAWERKNAGAKDQPDDQGKRNCPDRHSGLWSVGDEAFAHSPGRRKPAPCRLQQSSTSGR